MLSAVLAQNEPRRSWSQELSFNISATKSIASNGLKVDYEDKDLIHTNITNISNKIKSIRNLLQELLRFTAKVSPPWLARFEWQLGQPQPSQHVIPPLEILVPPKMTACKKSVGHQGAAAACAATLRCCPGASKVM